MPTYKIYVKGRVQGVNYRQSARNKAKELGVKGYVRNLDDGNVEILATGTKDQIVQLVEWAKKGPAMANVTEVISEEIKDMLFDDFEVMRG